MAGVDARGCPRQDVTLVVPPPQDAELPAGVARGVDVWVELEQISEFRQALSQRGYSPSTERPVYVAQQMVEPDEEALAQLDQVRAECVLEFGRAVSSVYAHVAAESWRECTP